jgi:5-methylcytosine-specific restriction endonuclease McrA
MPRRLPADQELIYKVYDETLNKAETARRCGVHPNTVYQALRQRAGICTRCGKAPALATMVVCDSCRIWSNEREARKRAIRMANGQCLVCAEPVDTPISHLYCREHRLGEALRKRRNIANGTRKPPNKDRIRERNLRNVLGEGAVIAWRRDKGICQSCGATPDGGRRMCVHHLDINRENNVPENLVVLCEQCHLLFHKLILHPKAATVIAWATRTYPDFEARFQGGLPVGRPARVTPTGRSA